MAGKLTARNVSESDVHAILDDWCAHGMPYDQNRLEYPFDKLCDWCIAADLEYVLGQPAPDGSLGELQNAATPHVTSWRAARGLARIEHDDSRCEGNAPNWSR